MIYIYIGSTCQKYLSYRFSAHKSNYKTNNDHYYTSYKLLKYDDCQIILIEEYPTTSQSLLLSRERFWIETLPCVNKVLPVISKEEKKEYNLIYNEINKEKMHEQQKQYREKIPEIIKQRKSDYHYKNKEKCNQISNDYYHNHIEESKEYYQKNKDHQKEYKQVYNEKNKDIIIEKRKIKNADPIFKEKTRLYDGKIVHCDICDIDMNRSSLLRHNKRKHINI